MEKLTEKQKIVINAICNNPDISLRGICKILKVNSVGSALCHVRALEKKGVVSKTGKNTNIQYHVKKEYQNINKVVWFDSDLKEIAPPDWRFNGSGIKTDMLLQAINQK